LKPLVSVIVPVYGGLELLRACLRQLVAQSWPAERREILVVDNHPTPCVARALGATPGARVIEEAAPGSYAARNAGIREARGELLAFTDADCLPAPDWIEQAVAALEARPDTGFVGGAVELFARDPQHPTGAELYDLVRGFDQERYLARKRFLPTANLVVRRRVMEEVGLFDACLRSGGDADWGERASAAGMHGAVVPGAVVRHPARHTLAEVCRKAARVAGGNLQRGRHALWADLARCVLPELHQALRYAARPKLRGPRQRLAVAGVRVLTGYVKSWERMRIRLGGRPRR
jgi:glycosyltransferase involved in cell wall biosynthesis